MNGDSNIPSELRRPFLRRVLPQTESNCTENSVSDYGTVGLGGPADTLTRHLTLMDLVAIGIGGTIGSGLFVLAGLVSHQYAGPAAVLSWALAGMAALVSGCCYAELAGRIPLAGSAYIYCSVALGEWPAFLAAVCLSVEYIASSSAVARSWGDKFGYWIAHELGESHFVHNYLNLDGIISPMAFVASSASVIMLLVGIQESKNLTNFFTILKVSLVTFMIVGGCFYVDVRNWTPLVPQEFGLPGVFRGATGTFFGYIGYDQMCGMAGEAQNPKRNLPWAVGITLSFVTIVYMTASLVLTGMQPWEEISPVSGFPAAFFSAQAPWAGQIIAIGEIVTLPIVVLITIMIQPRLQYALAEDGLLPAFFRKLDSKGNLWNGTLVAGVLMIIVATAVPFENLNDATSCAVLMVLSFTDSSVILLWHEAPDPESSLPLYLILIFHVASLSAGYFLTNLLDTLVGRLGGAICIVAVFIIPLLIQIYCPRVKNFGGLKHHCHESAMRRDDGYFHTPWVPFFPFFGIFINCYLIVQLDIWGILGLVGLLTAASFYYFFGPRAMLQSGIKPDTLLDR